VKGFNIMKQAKEMAQRIEKLKEDLTRRQVEATVGGGMVKILANGENQILRVEIAREAIDPEDKEILEDLIVSAVNEVLRRVQEMVNEEMSALTGGINLPGMM
jgi:nucleoid-associated protein EbfC